MWGIFASFSRNKDGGNRMDTEEKLIDFMIGCDNIAVLTGAGMSTASGIPDFRGNGGISKKATDVPYETLLSIDYFYDQPDRFYSFLRENMIHPEAKPNIGHITLADMEPEHVKTIITQNIDNLHQAGGSKNVIEIHGTLENFYCTKCFRRYSQKEIMETKGVPYCKKCNGLIRPDIVFYGEQLDQNKIERAVEAIEVCKLLLVLGTSLVVYPAAGLIRYMKDGAKLAIINRDSTNYDSMADFSIHGDMIPFFEKLQDAMR
jgi:NAD-dependent deacetylase